MEIIPVETGPFATNGYLVIDGTKREGVIIDTPPESAGLFKRLTQQRKVNVVCILLTHTHWDHTADCAELMRSSKVPIYVHKSDYYRLENPTKHSLFPLPYNIEPVYLETFVNNGDIINCGSLHFEVRHTPGHTEGGICFIEHQNKVIFAGDTLFFESIGRTDLPGGDYDTLINSIASELFTLDDDYKVYCGHGSPTTIGYEKANNPFINLQT